MCECNFPSIGIHSALKQEERIEFYKMFKDFRKRILVATDIFGRGIDIERVNIVGKFGLVSLRSVKLATSDSERCTERARLF